MSQIRISILKFNLLSFLIVSCFICTFTPLCYSRQVFSNEKGHFSLSLPDEWDIIPDDAMSLFNEGRQIKFDVGFHKNNQEYPYALVLIDNRGREAITDMQQLIALSSMEEGIENISGEIKTLESNKYLYDKKKGIVFTKEFGESQAGQRIVYATANILSKQGAIYIYLYDTEKNFDNSLIDFEKIINSFNLEEDYRYSNIDNRGNAPVHSNNSLNEQRINSEQKTNIGVNINRFIVWDLAGKLSGIFSIAIFLNFLLKKLRKKESTVQKILATALSTLTYIIVPSFITRTSQESTTEVFSWIIISMLCGIVSGLFFIKGIRLKKVILIAIYGYLFQIPATFIFNLGFAFTSGIVGVERIPVDILCILIAMMLVNDKKLLGTKNL